MLVLYVVQLKRLTWPLSLLFVDPGVCSMDFLGTFAFAGVKGSSAESGSIVSFGYKTSYGLDVGVVGVGSE